MKVAFVTGVGKKTGIGFEVCRGLLKNENYHVIFNARNEESGKEILDNFEKDKELKGKAHLFLGDLTKDETLKSLKKLIEEKFNNQLDILVNNAGIIGSKEGQSFLDVKIEEIIHTYEINTLVPLRLCQEFVPLMKKNGYGRIVNVSSGMGQLNDMGGNQVPYRFSKVSLNALTKIIDSELKNEKNILCNCVCPGFVKIEFNSYNVHAKRTTEEGADTIVWLSTIGEDGPRGKFFRDRKEIQW